MDNHPLLSDEPASLMSEISLSEPDITESEIAAVTEALRKRRLSGGPRRDLFEQMIAERVGRRNAITTSSGSMGLRLVLDALDIGPDDEVVTTTFAPISTANCILRVGARPVFVDIDPNSLNLDPAKLQLAITAQTKAIIATEVFGNARHMHRIEQIALNHEVPLIEDARTAFGGRFDSRLTGSFGRASVVSFSCDCQITTGEGGAIVTDDDRLTRTCRSLRNQGRPPDPDPDSPPTNALVDHERLGDNCRLSELACSLGVAQMERIDQILSLRREVAARYMRHLLDWDDLVLPNIPPGNEQEMSWGRFVIRLNNLYGRIERNRIITGLRRHEVGTANDYPCIHLQPFYQQMFGFKKGDFPIAESISDRTIALPFHNRLDETQVELVCHTLRVMIQREQLLQR